MSKKNGKAPAKAHPNGASGLDLSNEEILNAGEGLKRLLALRLPVALSLDLRQRFQVIKFAAEPVNDARDALVKRFAKKDRKGNAIAGEASGTVVLRDADGFKKESLTLLKARQRLKVTPIKRADIPERVDGKLLTIEGEVWELLGPLFTD